MRSLSKVLKGDCIRLETQARADGGSAAVSAAKTGDLKAEQYEKMIWRARMEANKIVSEAEAFYQSVIEQAAVRIFAEEEEARKKGFAEGFRAGEEAALQGIRGKMEELQALIEKIENERESVLTLHEADLKELALTVAEKIIETALTSEEQAFLSIYRNAIQEINGQEWMRLTVSPFEFAFATANAELLKGMVRGAQSIKISVLEDAAPGTCIVETPQSIVDASADTQMSRLREALDAAGVGE